MSWEAKADFSVSLDLSNGHRIASGKKPNHPKPPKRCKNDEKTVIKLCKNSDAREGKLVNTSPLCRKLGCNHIVPTAPFSFNDAGRQHS